MTTDLRLLLAGALTILAGYLSSQPVTMVVGVIMVGGAIYRDLIALAAQPILLLTIRPLLGSSVRRGGLGAQNRSESDFLGSDEDWQPFRR